MVNMLRNFLLVGGLALMRRGSTGQLLLGALVNFVFIIILFYCTPMKKPNANFSNQAANLQARAGFTPFAVGPWGCARGAATLVFVAGAASPTFCCRLCPLPLCRSLSGLCVMYTCTQ